jgi:hypothetical protein
MTPVQRIRAKALEELERANRRLIPEDVVAAAKEPAHALHDCFEWDDSKAGHLYRIDQARALIREVKVKTVYEDRVVVSPVYVSDPDPNRSENAYIAMDVVRRRQDDARRVVLDELSRIESAIMRAKAVSSILGLRDDLEKMIEALIITRERLAA